MGTRVCTILLCDDNDLLRELLARIIEGADDLALVGQVGSAEELLDMLAGASPDVILLDVNLPGLNGIDGIAPLRDAGYMNPIVIMSADRRNEHLAEAAGAAAFFYKGNTDVGELFSTIRSAIAS
ncbi:MAG TPA: response regulator transcription factor [Acidimicrobiia bacterium]|nr:response regulator transcription factor [Acidimicrobiia bacterium]